MEFDEQHSAIAGKTELPFLVAAQTDETTMCVVSILAKSIYRTGAYLPGVGRVIGR